MRRTISAAAIGSSIIAGITKNDIIFIISIIVTLLNFILEYLRDKRNERMEKDKSSS